MIEFEGVSKTYPDGTTAIEHLDLVVPSGSLTVFVGPSGCGKTTSMRMINRMVEPTTGRILVDGEDIAAVPTVSLRQSMGYVIQGAGLFPHRDRTGQRRDHTAADGHVQGRGAGDERATALRLVRLRPELDDRFPSQLSGGQQQRVGVARALAADPPILLMDEPFSAVDPVVRAELQAELLRLRDDAVPDDRLRHPRHRRGAAARGSHRGVRSWRDRSTSTRSRRPSSNVQPTPSSPRWSAAIGDSGSLGFHADDLPVHPLGERDAQGSVTAPSPGGMVRRVTHDRRAMAPPAR